MARKPDLSRLAVPAQGAGLPRSWRVMLPIVRADSDSDADTGFDFDDGQRGGSWDSVLGVLRTVGGAIVVVAALVILYLAFRGPSSRPPAGAAPAPASPYSPYATGTRGVGQGTGGRSATTVPTASSATVAPTMS